MVICDSIYDNQVEIPRSKLVFRASVYAVLLHGGSILLVTNKSSGKYFLPGGGIEIGEPIHDALRREVREETGLEIEIDRFLHFKEHFFYYDPLDEAFHSFMFFYLCHPRTAELVGDEDVQDGEAQAPRWHRLADLRRDELQRPLWDVYDVMMTL